MADQPSTRSVTVHLTGTCAGGCSVAHDQTYTVRVGARGFVTMDANCGACGKAVHLTGDF